MKHSLGNHFQERKITLHYTRYEIQLVLYYKTLCGESTVDAYVNNVPVRKETSQRSYREGGRR